MSHDTSYTDTPICPECAHSFADAFEWADEGERKCGFCDKPFRWQRDVSVTYTTKAVLEIVNESKP